MIHIGSEKNYISINVLYRNYPDVNDYWDGNWLTTEINVYAGSWKGKFQAQLRTEELLKLKENIEILYQKIDYRFEFNPMEPWIVLKFVGNKMGQIEVQGEACDQVGIGNKLKFSFEIDQSYLPKIIQELEKVTQEYPIKGNP